MKRKQSSVNRVIFNMLVENTGISMLDSGGTDGRSWQRNQGKKLSDFVKEPTVTFDSWGNEPTLKNVSYTISVFHYLVNQLAIDDLCRKFNRMNHNPKDWDSEELYGVSQKCEDWLISQGAKFERKVWNTYNGDSNLSQILQYRNITIGKECYVVLQIHGGADARGGYSTARLFKLDNEYTYEGGFLEPENVYGDLTKKDGTVIEVSNGHNGYFLTDENGKEVDYNAEEDKLSLYLGVGGSII